MQPRPTAETLGAVGAQPALGQSSLTANPMRTGANE